MRIYRTSLKELPVILVREVRVRLRRPSFWVFSVLVPLLLVGLYLLPLWQASRQAEPTLVYVADHSGLFQGALQSTAEVHFQSVPDIDYGQRKMQDTKGKSLLLYIPRREYAIPRDAFLYYYSQAPSLEVQQQVNHQLQTLLRNAMLEDVYGLDAASFHSVESTRVRLQVQDAATGREAHVEVKSVAGTALAVLMVLALLLFGVQVMRGVQEERQTRLAELVQASVNPSTLMAGKVVGVACTALVQLLLWIAVAGVGIGIVRHCYAPMFQQSAPVGGLATKGVESMMQYQNPMPVVDRMVEGLASVNLGLMLSLFVVVFFVGYMLYGLLLAAVAARTNSHSESLPKVLLVGSPLLLVLAFSPLLVQAPGGALATWFTLVPFTAPAAIMLRLPFGLPVWQVVVALGLMLLFAALASLLAARSVRR